MKPALCTILRSFPVADLAGKLIASTQEGQEWSGQINADGDFLFWMPDRYGVLRLAKIVATNMNVEIKTFEIQTGV